MMYRLPTYFLTTSVLGLSFKNVETSKIIFSLTFLLLTISVKKLTENHEWRKVLLQQQQLISKKEIQEPIPSLTGLKQIACQ